jgi:hypothetical protein
MSTGIHAFARYEWLAFSGHKLKSRRLHAQFEKKANKKANKNPATSN